MSRFSANSRSPKDEPPPARLTSQTLREAAALFSYLLPYKVLFAAALACLFCSSLMALALPYLTGRLIDAAIGRAAPVAWLADVNTAALVLVGVLALQATFAFCHSFGFATVGERSLADLRRDTYSRLIRLPMAFYSQRRVGELTSRLSADLAQIQDTLITAAPHFLRQVTLMTGGIVLIALTSGRLTLVMLGSVPVLVIIAAVFGRRIRRTSRDAQDKLADTSVVVEETLQGIASVKAFTNEGYELGRYHNGLQVFLRTVLRGARYRAAFVSFIIFVLFGGIIFVLWYGASLVRDNLLSPGDLTQFMLYTMFVAGAMGSFAELYSQIQRSL